MCAHWSGKIVYKLQSKALHREPSLFGIPTFEWHRKGERICHPRSGRGGGVLYPRVVETKAQAGRACWCSNRGVCYCWPPLPWP